MVGSVGRSSDGQAKHKQANLQRTLFRSTLSIVLQRTLARLLQNSLIITHSKKTRGGGVGVGRSQKKRESRGEEGGREVGAWRGASAKANPAPISIARGGAPSVRTRKAKKRAEGRSVGRSLDRPIRQNSPAARSAVGKIDKEEKSGAEKETEQSRAAPN